MVNVIAQNYPNILDSNFINQFHVKNNNNNKKIVSGVNDCVIAIANIAFEIWFTDRVEDKPI